MMMMMIIITTITRCESVPVSVCGSGCVTREGDEECQDTQVDDDDGEDDDYYDYDDDDNDFWFFKSGG